MNVRYCTYHCFYQNNVLDFIKIFVTYKKERINKNIRVKPNFMLLLSNEYFQFAMALTSKARKSAIPTDTVAVRLPVLQRSSPHAQTLL